MKKDAASQRSSLLSKLRKAERRLVSSPTVTRLRAVIFLRNQIRSLGMKRINKSLLWSKQKFYKFSNKPHRMLVNKLKPHPFHSFPYFLMQTNGTPTYCPLTIFGDYYHKLYNCLQTDFSCQFTQEKFYTFFFFDSLHLPKLSPDHLLSLSSVITPEELAGVVNLLTPKSPGPDGLPISYYNTYLLILSPHLISLYALLLKGTEPHPQFLHAHISVIPKPGKDLFPP